MLVDFGEELRAAGLPIGSGDLLGFSCAVASLNPGDLLDIYWAGRTTLITRREHIPITTGCFAASSSTTAEDLPEPVKLVLEQSSIENQSVIEVPPPSRRGWARTRRRRGWG